MFDNKWQKKEMPLVSLIGMGGGIASPAFLASIVLNILKPTVFSPVDDTGVSDFNYTAESSAITSVDQVVTAASTPTKGGQATFSSASIDYTDSTYDSNAERVIVAFRNGNLGYVSVGEVSGDSINYGTKVNFSNGQNCENITCTYDSNSQKIVVTYRTRDFSTYDDLMAVVGTTNPNNNSITFGTPVVIKSGGTEGGYHASCSIYDPNAQRVVHIYSDLTNSKKGTAQVLQVDGNSVIFGPRVIFSESETFYPAVAYDTDTNQVILHYFGDPSNSSWVGRRSRVTLGTVSGNNISFGSSSTIDPIDPSGNYALDLGLGYDPISQKVVAAWRYTDSSNNNYGTVAVGTVNGTDISFESGSGNEFLSYPARENMWVYDSASQKMVLVTHEDASPQSVKARIATISGNTITLSNPVEIEDRATSWHGITYDESNQRVVFSYKFSTNDEGRSTVISTINSATQLTLTDTTVSKVSDGSLVGGTTIDQVLTVGETVQADTAVATTVATPVFNSALYTGNGNGAWNGGNNTVPSGLDFTEGDWLSWIKLRNAGDSHFLSDSTQKTGTMYDSFASDRIYGKQTGESTGISAVGTNSYTIEGQNAQVNSNNKDYVAWNFKAAPGFFDIQTWDGNSTAGREISHNLGTVPGMILVKCIFDDGTDGATTNWTVYHKSLPNTEILKLNTNDQSATSNHFHNTTPTDQVFTLGSGLWVNSSLGNRKYIAYLFADTAGLIKCGKYTAPNPAGALTVNTGFQPHWVMVKCSTVSNSDWVIFDKNLPGGAYLKANESSAQDYAGIVFESTGFKINDYNNADYNNAGAEFIYIAIAENAEADITIQSTATGEVSESSGNAITLSNITGTWSTGMKVQGVTTDLKDNPSAISSNNVSLTSSAPTAERNVSTWGDAIWEVATDENFTQNVQTATTALSATGTQAGPSFVFEKETGYYTRTKYTALGQESEWSNVTYFVTAPSVYADDVFSTYLYTGNGSTQTIANGIDLAGEGGMVWIKNRDKGGSPMAWASNYLFDTARNPDNSGSMEYLITNQAGTSGGTNSDTTKDFGGWASNGFLLGEPYSMGGDALNGSGDDFVSWTFRKAPGFFDVVTWTGTNDGTRIPHNLGSLPGMIIVKNLDSSVDWKVYAKKEMWIDGETYAYYRLSLNNTNQSSETVANIANTDTFNPQSMGSEASGTNYIAYLFADDDARFGTNSDESIIKCGSFTTGSSSDATIDLGWEPQWLMYKRADGGGENWQILDVMRGWADRTSGMQELVANATSVEVMNNGNKPTSTGFKLDGGHNNNATYIYVAIRRPHKPATSSSDLFAVSTWGGTAPNPPAHGVGFPVDLVFHKIITSNTGPWEWSSRLTATKVLGSHTNAGESTDGQFNFDYQTGAHDSGSSFSNHYGWMFKRSPGFMDVVTYTGTGIAGGFAHNLAATPEFMIIKRRDQAESWVVYTTAIDGSMDYTYLNGQNTKGDSSSGLPTSTVFNLSAGTQVNAAGGTYVAYLFATLPGISKVGSYTAAGAGAKAIDCGFTNGTAFLLVKNVSSSGDWYLLDSERGINAYNETEPYLTLNNKNQEQTANMIGYKDTGFMVNGSSPLNNGNDTYIFLAIANP